MFSTTELIYLPVSLYIFLSLSLTLVQADYGEGFHNKSGCLYTYMSGASFEMVTGSGPVIVENFSSKALKYDLGGKSKCLDEKTKLGKVVFSYEMEKNKHHIDMVTVSMRIASSPSEGTWEISQANLTVTRAVTGKKRVFPLKVADLYAGSRHSYSCNELILQSIHKRKPDNETDRIEPRVKITLERFQLQPFEELENVVFASSFDCSTWISMAGLMGLVLIMFITVTVVGGVHFLSKIETNDFKYNKEGQMFTQSQIESNKR